MRTTLSIDDDVLAAVKDRARREGRTAGQVITELVRRELTRVSDRAAARTRNAFPVLPSRGAPISNALIDRLRDEEDV